jgi:hypothetical protein
MRQSIVVTFIAALLAVPATAGAVPGGSVAGSLTIDWESAAGDPSGDWTGHAVVVLDPGDDARAAAIAALGAAVHKRQPKPTFDQGGHIDTLTSEARATEDCSGAPEIRSRRVTAVTDPRLPFQVDPPTVDLLRRRGEQDISLADDNEGDPLPLAGQYFLPVPGAVSVRSTDSGCLDAPPTDESSELPAFDAARDAIVPFAFASWLNTWKAPLRLSAGRWSATGTAHFTDTYSGAPVTMSVAYDVRLVTSLGTAFALCRVPSVRDLRSARTAHAALAVLGRAGFPRARLAAARRGVAPRGRYYVDPSFTSSGYAPCSAGRPPVRRSLGPRRALGGT